MSLDFLRVEYEMVKGTKFRIVPQFIVGKSKDLMIRGKDFYAIWDEESGVWSTDEDVAIKLIDKEIKRYYNENKDLFGEGAKVEYLRRASNGGIDRWHKFVQKQMRDNYIPLDSKLVFLNDEPRKEDYATKRLPYAIGPGETPAYDKLMDTIFDPEEKQKLEWAIGAVISGDSKKIQKMMVLYGGPGTGKSTFLTYVVQELFDGYYSVFDAKDLVSKNSQFSMSAFSNNPLVAIQHDGDLSNAPDLTRLNSVISHEKMIINEKFKSPYEQKIQSFLFVGTNEPVDVSGSKSGMTRRLIDVRPSGRTLSPEEYDAVTSKMMFEHGAIADHCLKVYKKLGPNFYKRYEAREMKFETDYFYNFVADRLIDIVELNGGSVTLKDAYDAYKQYCEESEIKYKYTYVKVKSELKDYFDIFKERQYSDGQFVRNYYADFKYEKLEKNDSLVDIPDRKYRWIEMRSIPSLFDSEFAKCKAQYELKSGGMKSKWMNCDTKLSDISTNRVHYVKVPTNLIVIDFDIKDKDGNKDPESNLEAASKWPETYAEFSKSGAGMHLHYFYSGDVTKLSNRYDDDIEIKVFTGGSSLRRRLSKCNDIPIATISSGLPLKGDKKMVDWDGIENERMLKSMIFKALKKGHHGATKPEVDFIDNALNEAYNSGIVYDVSDLKKDIMAFASNSTHNADYCVKKVGKMKFKSEKDPVPLDATDDRIIFFDVEVFPNLFVLCWKYAGTPMSKEYVYKMINPTPKDVKVIMNKKLIGFNNRRYDNHIITARVMGYSNSRLYDLSKRLIEGHEDAFIGEAWNASYTDTYDMCSEKMSLKKWEYKLDRHHQENHYDWDKPVEESHWTEIADYCANDVLATEAVFNARHEDFVTREILCKAANILCPSIKSTLNDTTNTLTTRIIFRGDKNPQKEFVYTDLSELFPGYSKVKDENGKIHNMYRGEDVGFGGYVYGEPGIYINVGLLDVASMHPHSIKALNLFGKYTKNYTELMDARIAIKHGNYDLAKTLLNGALENYISSDMTKEAAKSLSQALKIAINSVYGLTSASFPNPFRDPRNDNNIVALRGALFMVELKHAIQEKGYSVCHIKTDSCKIPNVTKDIIDFVVEFGKKYGYEFEHEATFDRYCLVNNAVYICKVKEGSENGAGPGEWSGTGTQFNKEANPYVFKTLFSHEPLIFTDRCVTKTVTGNSSLYLDMNEGAEDKHNYIFVGKVGRFCPMKPGTGGGVLYREKDGKYFAATGTKGYRWMESEMVKNLGKENDIDNSYFDNLVDEAKDAINEYGSFEDFVSEAPYFDIHSDELPF